MRGEAERAGALADLDDPGAAGATGPSDPTHQGAGRRRAGPPLARVRHHVQRAAVLRAAALRSPLPLLPVPVSLDEDAFDASSFAKNKARLLEADVARASSRGSSSRRRPGDCCRPITSPWTARCSRPGRRSRASGLRASAPGIGSRPMIPATPRSTSVGSSARTPSHWSLTDLDALLTRKGAGKEAKLAFSLNVLMENRHGLCVDVSVARATGYGEREEALRMVRRQRGERHPRQDPGRGQGLRHRRLRRGAAGRGDHC
jgi:hypothetical protein